MDSIVKIDPEITHGTPCFAEARVLIKSLFDWLAGGETIDYWLEQSPTVRREQAVGHLTRGREQAEPAARETAHETIDG